MTRVIHTADTHLGYRQYHSPERRADFLDAFEQVIADAVEDDVDAVIHAGDLFHDRRPDLPDLLGTLSALRQLDEADIPFLAIVGNHESTRGGQWLDLFESLGLATRLGDEPEVIGETAFYGLDHVPESKRADLEYEFTEADADHAALVAHGLFEPFSYANWDTERVIEESNVPFDALLLGDNHTPDTAQVADTWVSYPGSTERASASERDGRGYNIVTFDDEVTIRRRGLDTREFVFVSVELAEGEGVERVRDRIREHDVTDAVVIAEVTGDGEPVTPADIEEFATERGALIARVTDRREIDPETDTSVEFADPDRAVEERLAEVAFSVPAHEIDGVIRDETVADSNVRERVERAVRERLEAGSLQEAVDTAGSLADGEEPIGEEDGGSDAESSTGESDETDTSKGTDTTDETNDSRETTAGDETDDSGGESPDGSTASGDEPTDEADDEGSTAEADDGESSDGQLRLEDL